MSLIKDISPKSLYLANVKLLQSIFRHPPDLSTTAPTSYFNSILHIHQLIMNDLTSISTGITSISTPETAATIVLVSDSLITLESTIFGEVGKKYKKTVQGCCSYTDALIQRLETRPSSCILL